MYCIPRCVFSTPTLKDLHTSKWEKDREKSTLCSLDEHFKNILLLSLYCVSRRVTNYVKRERCKEKDKETEIRIRYLPDRWIDK